MTSDTSVFWRRSILHLWFACLVLAALADWLFYRQPVGWTLGIFGLAALSAIASRSARFLTNWPGRMIALGVAGLLVNLVLQSSRLSAILSIWGLVTIALINRHGWNQSAARWFSRWGQFLVLGWWRMLADRILAGRWRKHQMASGLRPAHSPLGRLFRLWIIPLLLTLVFVGLFTLANPVISHYLNKAWWKVWDVIRHITEYVTFWRILLWVLVIIWTWALLRTRIFFGKTRSSTAAMNSASMPSSGAWVVRCLVLFNAAFAVQTVMDIGYLWGGAQLPAGFTYAQYAHRGAYPLVATALLAGAFVLFAFRPLGGAVHSPWARRLVYLWLTQNLLLMVSTVLRLNMYVQAYGLSRWRVAAAIWMVLVGLGLLWIILRIVLGQSNAWLLGVNVLATVAVLCVVACLPVDWAIAWYNVQHCREVDGQGVPLDVAYLHHLGPEALPAVFWLYQRTSDNRLLADRLMQCATDLRGELDESLKNWRGWTLSRSWLIQHPQPRALEFPATQPCTQVIPVEAANSRIGTK